MQRIRQTRWLQAVAIMLRAPLVVYAATLVKQHTFSSGEVISSSEVNENFDQLFEAAPQRNPSGNGVQFAENVDASGFTINGVPVASSTSSYWSVATGGINYGSGNVGINQSTPAQPLDVNGNANIVDNLTIGGTLNVTGTITGTLAGLGSLASASTVDNGVWSGTALATVNGGTGLSVAADDLLPGLGAAMTAGKILTLPSNGLAAGTTELVISGGNVGIGTSSPTSKLEVNGSIEVAGDQGVFNLATGAGNYGVAFATTAQSADSNRLQLRAPTNVDVFIDSNDNGSTGAFTIGRNDITVDGASYSELFRVQENGRVGIGTAAPADTLEVVGDQDMTGYGNIPILTFKTASGTQASPGIVGTSATMGRVDFRGYETGGSAFQVGARIEARTTSLAWSGSNRSSNLRFYTVAETDTTLTERMRISHDGLVRIGDIAAVPAAPLHVDSGTTGTVMRLQDNDSTCDLNANSGAPTCSSDRRLKKNIEPIEKLRSLSGILSITPVWYQWKTQENNQRELGFIAQDIEKQFPELVKTIETDDDSHRGLQMGLMVPHLVGAFQFSEKKREAQIAALSAENKSLRTRLDEIESRLNRLVAQR